MNNELEGFCIYSFQGNLDMAKEVLDTRGLLMELVVKKNKRVLKGKHSEIILIINCEESQAELIEKILWSHFALGVAKV